MQTANGGFNCDMSPHILNFEKYNFELNRYSYINQIEPNHQVNFSFVEAQSETRNTEPGRLELSEK